MAKVISLEFTDEQWELIKNNYVTLNSVGLDVDCTEESFAYTIQVLIGRKVTSVMANKAAESSQNAFNR